MNSLQELAEQLRNLAETANNAHEGITDIIKEEQDRQREKEEVNQKNEEQKELQSRRKSELAADSLFGRYAYSPQYEQRVLIVSEAPHNDAVQVFFTSSAHTTPRNLHKSAWIPLSELDVEPTELITLEELQNAPEGTVGDFGEGYFYTKQADDTWAVDSNEWSSENLLYEGNTVKVFRWGWGV